jgi:hypothetical protein
MNSPALAADELFTVEGVVVDVTADSALAARDQAFEKAQIDAFTVLAGRMLPETSMDSFKAPDAATVSAMVQDYEVTNEKLSSVRYIGTYTISFRPKAVERYLNVQGATYTNVVSAPLVILPFYQVSGRNYLWSPYNVWMKAWNRAGTSGVPVPVIVPIGDLEDVSDIGDDDVFGYDPDKLAALLKRYDAGDAVIAIAMPDGNLLKAGEGDAAANGAVTISLYRTDRGSPEHVREMVVQGQPGDTLGKLLDRGVAEVQTALKQNWKEKTAVAAAPATARIVTDKSIVARVKINSLEEWAAAQKAIGRVNAVSSMELKSLSPKEALVELFFRGDEDMLRSAFAQSGITLGSPQYGGVNNPANAHLVYDLAISGRPVIQLGPQGQPYQLPGYGGGYQSPRNSVPQSQIQPIPHVQNSPAKTRPSEPFGGYAVKPRLQNPGNGQQNYTGQF